MTVPKIIGIIILYLLAAFIIGMQGGKRKIGVKRLLLISVIFTPLIGFIVLHLSEPSEIVRNVRYRCKRCKLEYTQAATTCPSCAVDGEVVQLMKVIRKSL